MGLLDLFRRSKDTRLAPYQPAVSPAYKVYGNRGTSLSGGKIQGVELNSDLVGSQWVVQCQEMLRTDPIVATSWRLIKQTLLSASWEWVSADETDPTANRLADYANCNWGLAGYPGEMEVSWEEQLVYLTDYVPYGYRYAEEIYHHGMRDGRPQVYLSRYADRVPAAHDRWLSRDGQTLDGVMQLQRGSAAPPCPIPASKLLLLTHSREGANFEGTGLLRPAYWYWRAKQDISNQLTIGISRWAVPTPIVQVDRGMAETAGYSQEQIEALVDEAEAQAMAYVSAESSYLVEPSSVVKFASYGSGGELNVGGVEQAISLCDHQITSSMMTQMINLGVTDTGARSVGEIHQNLFRRSCINLLDTVASAVNGVDRAGGGTIGRLIKFNFGEIDSRLYPKLTHTGLDSDQLAESLPNLPALVTAQLLTPDDELESAVRQRIGVSSDMPVLTQRSAAERTAMSTGGVPSPTALAEKYARLKEGVSG